jgi:hypothetical protein
LGQRRATFRSGSTAAQRAVDMACHRQTLGAVASDPIICATFCFGASNRGNLEATRALRMRRGGLGTTGWRFRTIDSCRLAEAELRI